MPLLVLALATPPDALAAVGVVVSQDPARSMAILRLGDKSRVAGVGETVFGGRITAISPRAVTLDFDGRSAQIPVKSAGGPPVAPPSPSPPAPAPGAKTLARADLEKRLGAEMPRILSETVLTPVNAGGIHGFSLNRVPEGSLLTEAGLQEGDVLTEVDGVPIDSLATLMSLYPRLQTASEVRAVVLRKGQPVT
ncbi:MAG TPA: PDZ domain-containing protein, partial [Vicinamibacteria bacterium]|nr:PDZ domain-containing protein [Vicinamibacteria bacterium]